MLFWGIYLNQGIEIAIPWELCHCLRWYTNRFSPMYWRKNWWRHDDQTFDEN